MSRCSSQYRSWFGFDVGLGVGLGIGIGVSLGVGTGLSIGDDLDRSIGVSLSGKMGENRTMDWSPNCLIGNVLISAYICTLDKLPCSDLLAIQIPNQGSESGVECSSCVAVSWNH